MQTLSTLPARRTSSSFSILADAFDFCRAFVGPLLKVSWPILVALQVFELMSDQYFDYVSEVLQRRGSENLLLLGGTAFLEFLSGLIFMAAWFLAIVPALEPLRRERESAPRAFADSPADDSLKSQISPPSALPLQTLAEAAGEIPRTPPLALSLGRNFRLHLNQILIEQTRVFAAILWRLPFLLILAPLEYIRLLLVPYIVVLEPRYQAGEIDALRASREMAKRRWILLGTIAVVSSLLPLLIKQLILGSGNIWIWESPLRTMVNSVMQFFANLLVSMILFAVFNSLRIVMIQEPAGSARDEPKGSV